MTPGTPDELPDFWESAVYNTNTGKYTFLDDPSEAFDNGVEVTQITGITNSGEITGFYSDANGVFHGFVATP